MRTALLDAPDRTFSANWGFVRKRGDHVELAFGQVVLEAATLSTLIVVSLPKDRLVVDLLRVDPDTGASYAERVQSFSSEAGLPRIALGDAASVVVPEERVALEYASIVSSAFSGPEAELDFHKLSPWDLHRFRTQGVKVEVATAVLRVYLPTGLLNSMLQALVKLAEEKDG